MARPTPTAAASDAPASDAPAPKGVLRQWTEALVFAVVVVLLVRTLLFDLFRIPTPSMEKNLLVGDYLFVSKLHYGTRLPMTLGVPFLGLHVPGVTFPYKRLPGFGGVERGDAIVFNYPPQDGPVDQKEHYIKRVIGLPGDSLAVRDKVVYAGRTALPLGAGMQQAWLVYKRDARYRLSTASLRELGIGRMRRTRDPSIVEMYATKAAIATVEGWPWVEKIEPALSRPSARLYPTGRDYSRDNYGPVYIPKRGDTITLTDRNWPVVGPVINRYEGRTARQMTDSTFAIDGDVTTRYTFGQNYYFVMGDNRDNSEDSRFWGFVPFDHVVGKAVLTYFSWDAAGSPFLVGQIRYGRLLRPIADGSLFEADTLPAAAAAPTEAAPTEAAPTETPPPDATAEAAAPSL